MPKKIVPFHCHYSQVHSGPKWLYLSGSNLMGQIDLLKNYPNSIGLCAKKSLETATQKSKYKRTMNAFL